MLRPNELGDDALIIAEVGQNHQGDFDMAREYIRTFAGAGADVVKFQTRDNRYLFAEEAYAKSYNSENAFAPTYGKHRESLELDADKLHVLREDCAQNEVLFMSTPFDEPSLERLVELGVALLKIASFDLGNLPLIDKIGRTGLPVVLSVGGGNAEQIKASVETLRAHHDDIAVLHCVSEYPCPVERLGLDNIDALRAAFPDLSVGLSDHFNGILSGPVAYLKGARVFEKHVTLNRSLKGTDHSFSLEPGGFRRFVRDIRRVPQMMTPKPAEDLGTEAVFQKLGKSLVAARPLAAGAVLTLDDLSGRIFNEQIIPVRRSVEVIGRRLKVDLEKGAALRFEMLELPDSAVGDRSAAGEREEHA